MAYGKRANEDMINVRIWTGGKVKTGLKFELGLGICTWIMGRRWHCFLKYLFMLLKKTLLALFAIEDAL